MLSDVSRIIVVETVLCAGGDVFTSYVNSSYFL